MKIQFLLHSTTGNTRLVTRYAAGYLRVQGHDCDIHDIAKRREPPDLAQVDLLLRQGLGEPLPFWSIAGFWSFTYFVTLLPISINGLGLQELSMTFIFTTLGGVSVSTAATAALLVRTIQMLASIPGAAFLPDILSGMRQPHHPPKE